MGSNVYATIYVSWFAQSFKEYDVLSAFFNANDGCVLN